jgi:hypothetical protein
MRAAWILPEGAARLLAPAEREAVLGDLVEAGDGPWTALAEIGGLVLRRQAGLWRNWRPWVAAFGVSVPTSFMLMGNSVVVSLGVMKLAGTGSAGQPLAAEVERVAAQALLLAGWSWTCGYLVGSLSRRTVWFSVISYGAPCLFCLSRFRIESLSRLSLLLFVLPAAAGLWRGLRGRKAGPRLAVAAAAVITALAVLTRLDAAGGGVGGSGWIGGLILTWPSWFLAAISLNAAREDKGSDWPPLERQHHEPS